MQIFPTADQLHIIREYGEPIALPFIVWAWKRGIKKLKETLNEIITNNVNRIRDEMVKHLDAQLQVHMDSDDRQFGELKRMVREVDVGKR